MECPARVGGVAPNREFRVGVPPLAAACRGGGNRCARRADCRGASSVARRAALTRGCAKVRLGRLDLQRHAPQYFPKLLQPIKIHAETVVSRVTSKSRD